MKPLQGIKVLDLTQFFAGPLCTMLLGDLGAEVIKLENPGTGGDTTRYTVEIVGGTSSNYSTKNRNKKSVLMDLKDERQKGLFLKMAETADVVVENYRPGTMEKYGLSYEVLRRINPKLVYTSISGYGSTGPMRDYPAVDGAIQAVSGFMSLTGLNGIPTQSGPPIADAVGGFVGAIGTLGALVDVQRTGAGRYVDVSLLDSMLATYEDIITRYNVTGIIPQPIGNRHANLTPFQPFTFRDSKQLYICVATDAQWVKLCRLLGHPEWCEDPNYVTISQRSKNRDRIVRMVQEQVQDLDANAFAEEMRKQKLVCSEINNIEQVVELPQVKARNMMVTVTYPDGIEYIVPGCPIKMSGMEEPVDNVAYPLGHNTVEVLSEYAPSEVIHEIYDGLLKQAEQAYDRF